MADTATARLVNPVSDQPMYIGKGALGGYIGAYAMAKYYKYDNIEPLGRYQIESALAGAVGSYIWLVVMGDAVDTESMWKGVAIGAISELIYNRWLKAYVTGIYA